MPRYPLLPPLFLAAAAVLAPGVLAAQAQPVSKQLEIAPPLISSLPSAWHFYLGATAIDLGPQGFAVAWLSDLASTDWGHDRERIFPGIDGLRLDCLGRPGAAFDSTFTDGDSQLDPPILARLGGGFVTVYRQTRYGGAHIWFRRFLGSGQPLDERPRLVGMGDDGVWDWEPAAASNTHGQLAITWTRGNSPDNQSVTSFLLRVFDSTGEPVTPEIEVLPASQVKDVGSRAVGMDDAGNAVLVWQGAGQALWFARYDRLAQRLDGPRRLGNLVGNVSMAMDRTGGFVMATLAVSAAPPIRGTSLWLRAFRPDGTQSGTALEVYRSPGFSTLPTLARDRFGNVALFWFDADKRPALALVGKTATEPVVLVRQGPVVFDSPASFATGVPSSGGGVTLGDDGRILTVWTGLRGSRARESVLGRLWQARKDADLCVVRGDHVLCDTANDGGNADLRFLFGQSGGIPVLGDLDGDGRADLCVFRDRHFVCDTAHNGGTPEGESVQFSVVPPGAQLLLADVDGEDDGRADPCYRDGSRWVCLVWNQIIGINLTGTFLVCRAALPALCASGHGVICNFSSTAARFAHPYMAAYAASKGGIDAFTHTVAVEYAKDGLRAFNVQPGGIESGITATTGGMLPADTDWTLFGKTAPLLQPNESGFAGAEAIAGVIAALASEDGKWVTGTDIRIDGGAHG